MITVATIRKIALALPGLVVKKGAPLEFRIGRKVLARVDIVAKTVKIAGVPVTEIGWVTRERKMMITNLKTKARRLEVKGWEVVGRSRG
jgi:hypothetical protein